MVEFLALNVVFDGSKGKSTSHGTRKCRKAQIFWPTIKTIDIVKCYCARLWDVFLYYYSCVGANEPPQNHIIWHCMTIFTRYQQYIHQSLHILYHACDWTSDGNVNTRNIFRLSKPTWLFQRNIPYRWYCSRYGFHECQDSLFKNELCTRRSGNVKCLAVNKYICLRPYCAWVEILMKSIHRRQ